MDLAINQLVIGALRAEPIAPMQPMQPLCARYVCRLDRTYDMQRECLPFRRTLTRHMVSVVSDYVARESSVDVTKPIQCKNQQKRSMTLMLKVMPENAGSF